jgi:hypothetical protein
MSASDPLSRFAAVAARFGLKKTELELRPANSRTPIFTNWHAHGLVRLQSPESPDQGLIVRSGEASHYRYAITTHGKSSARMIPLPPETLEGEAADAVEIVELLAGRRSSQAWRLSAAERQAIERHAVIAAVKHFENLGYRVEDVGAKESYDLKCTSQDVELHVEVKGTTTRGTDIVLTPNEVAHARQNATVALFLYSNISLRNLGGAPTCVGGEANVLDPWQIDGDGELRPIGYTYTLRS